MSDVLLSQYHSFLILYLSVLQSEELSSIAKRVSAELDLLLTYLEVQLSQEAIGSQEADSLKRELEHAQAELAQQREASVRDQLASTSLIQQAEARIAALQNEINDHAAQFEDAFRKISLEKQQAVVDLQTLQAGSAQYAEQIQAFKSHIQK